MADISFTHYNSDAFSCGTRLGWVGVEAGIVRRAERPRVHAGWTAPLPPSTMNGPREVILARAARAEREAPGRTRADISGELEWPLPSGRRMAYVAGTIAYPGGAPAGTPSRRHTRIYAAVVGDWMLSYTADGPQAYRETLDRYAEEGFGRLLASVEAANRILPPAG
jgi:hypothetical protein